MEKEKRIKQEADTEPEVSNIDFDPQLLGQSLIAIATLAVMGIVASELIQKYWTP